MFSAVSFIIARQWGEKENNLSVHGEKGVNKFWYIYVLRKPLRVERENTTNVYKASLWLGKLF